MQFEPHLPGLGGASYSPTCRIGSIASYVEPHLPGSKAKSAACTMCDTRHVQLTAFYSTVAAQFLVPTAHCTLHALYWNSRVSCAACHWNSCETLLFQNRNHVKDHVVLNVRVNDSSAQCTCE